MNFPWKKKEKKEPKPLTPKEISQAEVMGYLWFPAKQQEVNKMEESKLYALFEEAAEAILDYETCLTSPIDGNPMSFVRTTDALNALAEAMGVDIRQTAYEHFAK